MNLLFSELDSAKGSHARSNASVLIAARHRYPEATIVLHATEEHFARMKTSVDPQHTAALDSVLFEEAVYQRHQAGRKSGALASLMNALQIYFQTWRLLRDVVSLCHKHNCDVVVYLSGPGYHIQLAKLLSYLGGQRRPTVFIVHNWIQRQQSRLRRIAFPSSWAASRRPCRLPCRYVMQHGGMRSYLEQQHRLALGPEYVELRRAVVFGSASEGRRAPAGRIDFDFLSPSHKGVNTFCEYVAACREKLAGIEVSQDVTFGVIGGFVPTRQQQDQEAFARQSIERYPRSSLSNDDYYAELLRATYVVHLFDPHLFECRFSSAILDGIAWRLPAIFLANNYTRHLFEDVGRPGFQASSVDEAAEITVQIVREFQSADYESQVADVEVVRRAYSVETVAAQFGDIVQNLVA